MVDFQPNTALDSRIPSGDLEEKWSQLCVQQIKTDDEQYVIKSLGEDVFKAKPQILPDNAKTSSHPTGTQGERPTLLAGCQDLTVRCSASHGADVQNDRAEGGRQPDTEDGRIFRNLSPEANCVPG